jgi:membrane-associated phospholipid phosphatase
MMRLSNRSRTTDSPGHLVRGRTRRSERFHVEVLEDRCLMATDVVIEWDQVLLDETVANKVSPAVFPRDAAIMSAAVYDAVNSIDGSYTPYFVDIKAPRGASLEAAAAQAAHDTLSGLFPADRATFDATLATDLAAIPPGRVRLGAAVGQAVAQQILAWRSTDGFNTPATYVPGTAPGDWQPTPPAYAAAAFPQIATMTPFCIPSDSAFRPGPPPDLTSPEYAAGYNELMAIGAANSTTRTPDQTTTALFWADGPDTITIGGYWDEIAQEVAQQQGNSLVQDARLFAQLHLATADAVIGIWDAKYTYGFWRPVTAIRDGNADGNPDTAGDSTWMPLLTTPNHPSYVSGHTGLSGAAAVALASFCGTDNISFSLGSPTAPGVIHSFTSFSAAAQEVGQSRIYAGIHWPWDVQNGLALGEQVGQYVASNFLLPASKSGGGGADAAPLASTPGPGKVAGLSHLPGLLAGRPAIDASWARSPNAGPLSVGALDPTWWTSTTQPTDLATLPAAWSQGIDLTLADLAAHPRLRR